ncbi:bzip transcription factor [Sporothrix brasiliensis 5110]|uniref:Putative transcription factor kapC n=1 Tax=Sporothrix brasiliensis 5110 TaxID=1398154 RepID=A0A0C2IZ93_9PEZI|nr:bzip transcription factor [Sporothrix brasiliensis 5110]KIH90302.1 bzip transcription factor [Sporothrix brasiliensis 5110]
MARRRRAANASASSNENVTPALSSAFDDINAAANLSAPQKHVDAAYANSGANAQTAVKLEHDLQPADDGIIDSNSSFAYTASTALLAAHHADVNSDVNTDIYGAALGSSDPDAHIDPDLRPPLSPYSLSHALYPAATMSAAPPSAAPAAPVASPQQAPAPIPQQQQPSSHTAPVPLAPQQSLSPAGSQEHTEVITDGRKGPRRELSTSKRAAQNRAAQRAFRQRKEGYIKKLEQQVQDFGEMETQFKIIQSENYALREYIIHLQSRLLDAKAELPQPPANLNLAGPGMPPILGIGPSPALAAQQQQQQQQHEQQAQIQRQQQLHLQQQQPLAQQEPPSQYPDPPQPQQQQQARAPSPAAHPAATPTAAQAVAAAAAAAAAAADTSSREANTAAGSDSKNDSSLARVAQAVAQLGNNGNAPATAMDTSRDDPANGIKADNNTNGNTNGNGNDAGEPMDTSEEAISQKLQKLSEPVLSM